MKTLEPGRSTSRASAERLHSRRRSSERGSVVFIVMMAIVLLTSLGVWVSYAAGLTARSAGHQREAAQSLYVAELGVLAGTGYLAQPGLAAANYQQALKDLAEGDPDDCFSVPAGADRRFCKSIFMEEIETATVGDTGFNLLDFAAEGSLSPYAAVTEGTFNLEISDPRPADVMGTSVGSGLYQLVTISAYATVRPMTAGANYCTNAGGANSAASLTGMRAFSVIGPLK